MPHPCVHRSLGAASVVSSPGAAWQDGGAKPAAAGLWVSLPVSRGPRDMPQAARDDAGS